MSTEENTNDFNLVVKPKKIMPKYSFRIVEHSIGDNVEYQVELLESFKVFKKTITEIYKFKTRYSKLEALHQKVGGKGFPGKKIFGNKNP